MRPCCSKKKSNLKEKGITNMGFGRRLVDDLQEVGWENGYISYVLLKNIMYSLKYELKDASVEEKHAFVQRHTSLCSFTSSLPSNLEELIMKLFRDDFNKTKQWFNDQVKMLSEQSERVLNKANSLFEDSVYLKYEANSDLEENQMRFLSDMARCIDECKALKKFQYINNYAASRLATKVKREFEVDKEFEFLPINGDKIKILHDQLKDAKHNFIFCSSSLHDYLNDCEQSLRTERIQAKLFRNEMYHVERTSHKRLRKLKRMTRLTFLDSDIQKTPFTAANLVLSGAFSIVSTLFASYCLTFQKQKAVFEEKGYFISASIDRAPGANIGTLGLNISLMLVAGAVSARHKIVKKHLKGMAWMVMNRFALVCGLSSVFAGMGVAAFRHEDNENAHNMFAFLFFTSSLTYIGSEAFLAGMNNLKRSKAEIYATKIIVTLLVASTLGFLIPQFYLIGYCREYVELLKNASPYQTLDADALSNCTALDGLSKYCVHRKEIKLFSAVNEIIAFVCITSWYAMYYLTFTKYKFHLHVHRLAV
eukprot:snap_masked-scaffold_11-processed-gene-4.34-mRNA-1 protein AED:1.00 eAED:1.00 QI:0/-1/0/0/-1/1/1/0/535